MFGTGLTRLLIFAICTAALACGPAADAAPKKAGPAQKPKKPAAARLAQKSFDQLDADKNGFLSITEIFGSPQKKGTPARKAFDRADKDRNDWINRREFQLLKKAGLRGGKPKAPAKKGQKKKGRPAQPGKKRARPR